MNKEPGYVYKLTSSTSRPRTGTWFSDQMGHNISTVSRWMTNKVQPSVEQLYEIAHHLDVDVKELLMSSKKAKHTNL